MNFFLSQVSIDVIANNEIPKFLRRNLLGTEFLSMFIDVVAEEAAKNNSKIKLFLDRALWLPQRHTYADRATRNVGALLFSMLPYFPEGEAYSIKNFHVDDAVVRGSAISINVSSVSINQMDCRGADLSLLYFEDSSIVHLIADNATRFSKSFPNPKIVTDGEGFNISDAVEIGIWLDARGRNQEETVSSGLAMMSLTNHPIYKLLGKVCRIRQYWLRAEDDIYGAKVFQDRDWAILKDVLDKHGFLREEIRQASGRSSTFVHIRQSDRILSEEKNDMPLAEFFKDLASKVV